jgi:hypothetical protein
MDPIRNNKKAECRFSYVPFLNAYGLGIYAIAIDPIRKLFHLFAI